MFIGMQSWKVYIRINNILVMERQYWIIRNGESLGTFTMDELRGMGITPDTKVWFVDLKDWTPAGELSLFDSLFAATPEQEPQAEEVQAETATEEAEEKTFISIRNVPYSDLMITSVKAEKRKIVLPVLNTRNTKTVIVVEDVSQPNVYDAIVTLKDTAKITKDGAVVGGNKIKIGLPITLEGADYRLNGTVSNIQVTHGTDDAVNDQQLSAVENVQ